MSIEISVSCLDNLKLKPVIENIRIEFTFNPFSKVLLSDGRVPFEVRDFFQLIKTNQRRNDL